jgi:hypothetical protein
VGLAVTSAGAFAKAGRAVLLEAAQPFANRGGGGGKEPRGRLDAALLSALDEPQAMVVGAFHFTHQIEITGGVGHGTAILTAAAQQTAVEKTLRLKIPQTPRDFHFSTAATTTTPVPSCASDSNTSIPPGGYDVTGLFHSSKVLASYARLSIIWK